MFILVSKFKMIGMLLNFVYGQVRKSEQKYITKEYNGFQNHSTLHDFNNYDVNYVNSCYTTEHCFYILYLPGTQTSLSLVENLRAKGGGMQKTGETCFASLPYP